MHLTILGSGCYGVTLANLWKDSFSSVTLWGIDLPPVGRYFQRPIPHVLPEKIVIQPDLTKAVDKSDIVVLAVASAGVRDVCQKLKGNLSTTAVVINVAKGLETGTLKRLSTVIKEELPNPVMVLSGPNLAVEILQNKPTASVIAGEDPDLLTKFQKILTTNLFRIYTNSDIIGVELGGALKNIIAIASGFITAQNLGNNAKGAILARGMAEIIRLSIRLGARIETFLGLSGIGDLIATCSSELSRNYTVGKWLGEGLEIKQINQKLNSVAEGVDTAKNIVSLARQHNLEVPISELICRLVNQELAPKDAVDILMQRHLKSEEEY